MFFNSTDYFRNEKFYMRHNKFDFFSWGLFTSNEEYESLHMKAALYTKSQAA